MTTWNYRVFKETGEAGDTQLTIRQVYYDDAGHPTSHSLDVITAFGNSIGDVRLQLTQMLACLDKPVLTAADFPTTDD